MMRMMIGESEKELATIKVVVDWRGVESVVVARMA